MTTSLILWDPETEIEVVGDTAFIMAYLRNEIEPTILPNGEADFEGAVRALEEDEYRAAAAMLAELSLELKVGSE